MMVPSSVIFISEICGFSQTTAQKRLFCRKCSDLQQKWPPGSFSQGKMPDSIIGNAFLFWRQYGMAAVFLVIFAGIIIKQVRYGQRY